MRLSKCNWKRFKELLYVFRVGRKFTRLEVLDESLHISFSGLAVDFRSILLLRRSSHYSLNEFFEFYISVQIFFCSGAFEDLVDVYVCKTLA